MRYWQTRDISERLAEARLHRRCLKLCRDGIIGTHNPEMLTASDRNEWDGWIEC